MNLFDLFGDYQNANLVGGVFRDEEKNQYVVEDPLGLNLFTYYQNNPVRFADPEGKFAIAALALIGIAAGAIIGGAIGGFNAYTSGTSVLGGIAGGITAGLGMGIGAAVITGGIALSATFASFAVLIGVGIGALGGLIGSMIEGVSNHSIDIPDVLFDSVMNDLFTFIGGGLSKLMASSFVKGGIAAADTFFSWILGHVQMSISKIKDILFPAKPKFAW